MEFNFSFDTLALVCRYLVGLNFFFFGLNAFFNWLPLPEAEEKMTRWIQAMYDTGFVMTLVKTIEVVCGAMLLTNTFSFMAMMILSPIVVMVVLSQLLLNGNRGYGITAFTFIPYAILFISHARHLEFFLA